MVKLLLASFSIMFLVGCGGTIKLRTEVQEQFIPLLYCPAPPEFTRPILPISDIKKTTSNGEVAKKYKASILILQGYSLELERILQEYDNTDAAYEELRTRFKTQWKDDFGKAIEETQ